MKKRLLSAAICLPVLALILWVLPKIIGAIVFGILAAIAVYELLYLTGFVRNVRLIGYCLGAGFLMSIWSFYDMHQGWGLVGLLAFVSALFTEMMLNHVKVRFEKICMCVAGGLLIPYLLTSVVRILATYSGRYTVIIPFILAFLPDAGAYFAGRYFGRRKLAPVISPNKTVEGAVGAAVTAIVGMLLYAVVMDLAFGKQVDYAIALLYGVLGAAADIFGDLMLSSVKRQTGVKDFGNLIPGHGGILDRFDSMLMVGPLTEFLLILLPVVV